MVQERKEQRKRNDDRQRAYRERKSSQLEEARNQFVEQQQKPKCRMTKTKFNQYTSGTNCRRCSMCIGQRATC